MQAICDESNHLNEGTEYKNTHPVVIAYLDKLCSLAGIQAMDSEIGKRVADALDICRQKGEINGN